MANLFGVPVDEYGDAKTEAGRSLLAQEEEEEEEEEGPSPLAMGLLQLGASMMRDEGWRDRPITLGESLGKAIPRGIAGYYNQDALNRQYESEATEQRMLEQAASDQAALEQATELQKIEAQYEKVRRYKAFVANVESIPDSFFGKSAETALSPSSSFSVPGLNTSGDHDW